MIKFNKLHLKDNLTVKNSLELIDKIKLTNESELISFNMTAIFFSAHIPETVILFKKFLNHSN